MLSGQLYEPIYLIVVTIFTIIVASKYRFVPDIDTFSGVNSYFGTAITLCVFLILFIGFRPMEWMFGDTLNYYGYYKKALGVPFEFSLDRLNILFDNLLYYFAAKKTPISLLFALMSFVYFGAVLLTCRKLFSENTLIAFLIFLGAFSTYSYGVNGVKAGASASVFLLAVAYRENKVLAYTLFIISIGLHHSMNTAILAFFCSLLFKNTKIYFIGWVVCIIVAALHFQYFQFLFADYADEKTAKYLMAIKNDAYNYITGFRLDFILYSSVPILIGYWMIYKKKISDLSYEFWLRLYILTNSIWILCMYASFSNRIAYLSWSLFPILLVYPFLGIKWEENKASYIPKIAICHLAFTLFMALIY